MIFLENACKYLSMLSIFSWENSVSAVYSYSPCCPLAFVSCSEWGCDNKELQGPALGSGKAEPFSSRAHNPHPEISPAFFTGEE